MSFAFDPGASSDEEFRRIARDQIDAALETISTNKNPDKTVHSLRQRCKKLRALLQLVRPRFKNWRSENDAVRDLAAALSATRDSTVLADTLAGLLEGDASAHPIMIALRAHIAETGANSDYEGTMAQCLAGLEQLRDRAGDWALDGDGFKVLRPGFRDTYKRMRRGMNTAHDDPDDENFHAWRKQAKYHLYQLSLLRNAAPAIVTAPYETAKNLGDVLGKHHDLAVLSEVLRGERFKPVDGISALIEAAEEKQRSGEKEAFALGVQLAAEQPEAIARRFSAYWNSSRAGA